MSFNKKRKSIILNPRLHASVLLAAILGSSPVSAAPGVLGPKDFATILKGAKSAEIDTLVPLLPEHFRRNSTFKYGETRRPHFDRRDSRTSSPEKPRVFLWDDATGFNLSFTHKDNENGDQIELMDFDEATAKFTFKTIKFPRNPGAPVEAVEEASCKTCHGPDPRPVWGEYPTWEQIYGSDNDELAPVVPMNADMRSWAEYKENTPIHEEERKDFLKFAENAKRDPRYSSLFPPKLNIKHPYSLFPYRPNNSWAGRDASRAFMFRPNLRLGILLNRLNAKKVFKTIQAKPVYKAAPELVAFSFMGCNMDLDAAGKKAIQTKFQTKVDAIFQRTVSVDDIFNMKSPKRFNRMLDLLGIKLKDLDIRHNYNDDTTFASGGTKSDGRDPRSNAYLTHQNLYFDGSATPTELLSLMMLKQMKKYDRLYHADSLMEKYKNFSVRLGIDKTFFTNIDGHGKWLPLPYPKAWQDKQHRDPWTSAYQNQWVNTCKALFKSMREAK